MKRLCAVLFVFALCLAFANQAQAQRRGGCSTGGGCGVSQGCGVSSQGCNISQSRQRATSADLLQQPAASDLTRLSVPRVNVQLASKPVRRLDMAKAYALCEPKAVLDRPAASPLRMVASK